MLRSTFRAIIAAILATLAVAAAGTAGAATLPFTVAANQGVFLHLSDIHFNPFADPAIVPQLAKAPIGQWQSIFQSSKNKRFAHYGEDTNFPLFMSMLSAARGPRYDYVLNTGDNLAHKFRAKFLAAGGQASDYRRFVIKTLRFVNHELAARFPHAPLIYALGNNDAVCGDYRVAPASTMLAQVADDLPVLKRNPQAQRDFARGGYYRVPHPTVPDHDIIVLNSVFWSAKYDNKCGSKMGDPGMRELAWLQRTLAREKAAGRTASLAMHIPPGFDAYSSSHHACPQPATSFWHARYTRRFLDLIDADKGVLRASYAGHTHMDNFRVLSDKRGTPFLTTRITPSVSPVFGNNPAFTLLLYNRDNATVRNYATFYLANLSKAGPRVPAKWELEYTFAKTYGTPGYTPRHLAALAKTIRSNPAARGAFTRYYTAEAPSSPIKAGNWMTFACAQTAMTRAAYVACRCPNVPSPPEPAKAAPH